MVTIITCLHIFFIFWASPAFAISPDCEFFMYGSLCPTDHLSDIIWVIPGLDNEMKCQVFNNLIFSGPTNMLLRWSAQKQPTATISCFWNSHRELKSVSSFGPAMWTRLQFVLRILSASWQFRDLWPHLSLSLAVRSSKQCSVKLDMRLDTSLTSRLSGFANDCVEINFLAPTGLSSVVTASSTVPVEHQRLRLLGKKDCTFFIHLLGSSQSCFMAVG